MMQPREAMSFLQQLATKNPKQPLLWAAVQALFRHITMLEKKLNLNPIDEDETVDVTETEESEDDDENTNGLG